MFGELENHAQGMLTPRLTKKGISIFEWSMSKTNYCNIISVFDIDTS